MPFALILIGLIAVITGIRGTQGQFGKLLAGDFTGQNNFTYWAASLGVVGAIGYIEPLRPISRAFLVLLIVVFIIATSKKVNLSQQVQTALGTTQTGTAAASSVASSVAASAVTSAALNILPAL